MTTVSCFLPAAIFLLFSVSTLKAEAVSLNGTVRNQSASPVTGAEVKLLNDSSISATTDSTGNFKLTGQITSLRRYLIPKRAASITLHGSCLQIIAGESTPVSVTVYTIAGKTVYNCVARVLNTGINIITLPMRRFGAGYYMIAVDYEGNRRVFSYVLSASGSVEQVIHRQTSDGASKLSGRATLHTQVTVDTLLITAGGYKPAGHPVLSYDQSGIEIILERVSRLDNFTKSCDDLMPAPLSGGSSGWGSRYWDCCKPHCSWPDNTTRYSANCGADNKEIPCFKEVGNEYWTGLEGIKSGCEQGGEAFMCYHHVPFAICKDLAFGFAAVPSGDDACGKCFQLDFNGGFKHGDPKAAHALMKGKIMIVMASNIGHDVSGGQFDLMIPGGGLGAFRDGCAKQWNVDVTNEALVGKGLGGFISKCQEKLGWDADPEDYKICVRGMCDNLFGKDPALHDLWEGCIWYVEWMHTVDNPTFTYKQVDCPRELIELYYSSFHPKP